MVWNGHEQYTKTVNPVTGSQEPQNLTTITSDLMVGSWSKETIHDWNRQNEKVTRKSTVTSIAPVSITERVDMGPRFDDTDLMVKVKRAIRWLVYCSP